MSLNLPHQQNSDDNLFGILAGGFRVFEFPKGKPKAKAGGSAASETPEKKREHHVPKSEVMRAQEAIEEIKKDLKRSEELLRSAVQAYNKERQRSGFFERNKPHHAEVELNLKDPEEMSREVGGLIKAVTEAMADPDTDDDEKEAYEKQLASLRSIQQAADNVHGLREDLAKGSVDLHYANRARLRLKYERIVRGEETVASWEKQEIYGALLKDFEAISYDDEFEDLWRTPAGLEEGRHSESRMLFMAIMAEKTSNFTHPIVFGEEFGQNYEENIERFPFIYNEWFKQDSGIGVSLEAISAASNEVASKRAIAAEQDTVETIINQAGPLSGLSQAQLASLKTMPKDEAWQDRADLLNKFIKNLEEKAQKARDNDKLAQAKDYDEFANKLGKHYEYALAEAKYYRLSRSKEQFDKKFTRDYFLQPKNRKMALRLAMLRFQKAIQIVDHPLGEKASWQANYHPTVRRLLISNIYNSGVSEYSKSPDGKVTYRDNLSRRKARMLAAISRSEYFNAAEFGRNMDETHRTAMMVIDFGFQVTHFVEQSEDVKTVIDKTLEWKQAVRTNNNAKKARLEGELSIYPKAWVTKYAKMSETDLSSAQANYKRYVASLDKYLDGALKALENPYSKESQKFFASLRQQQPAIQSTIDELAALGTIAGPNLARMELGMRLMEENYDALDTSREEHLKFFERLGIRLEGFYLQYLEVLKDPEFADMQVGNWDKYFHSTDRAEFMKLSRFLDRILPESIAGGKADFIASFNSLFDIEDKAKYMQNPEMAGDHAVAISVYQMLKLHIQSRTAAGSLSAASDAKIRAKQKGMDIGDMATHQLSSMIDMVKSGDPAQMAAGAVLLFTIYKVARKAMKGEGKVGKLARIAFIAGAVEIFMKKTTGRGLLDRAGLDLLEDAMEGTYEEVLVNDAEAYFASLEDEKHETITRDEHERALIQMRDVPFNDLMEWYDKSKKQEGGAIVKLPGKIRPNKIVTDKKMGLQEKGRANYVVLKTMEHFFQYVGNKENMRGQEFGRQALDERWVKLVEDPTYQPRFTEVYFPEIAKIYRGKPNDLTWERVMREEIDSQEVQLTRGKTTMGKVGEAISEGWEGLTDWMGHYMGKFEGQAQEFYASLGPAARETGEWIGSLIDDGAREVYFKKESAKLWYKSHKYEIKRVAGQHWEIAVTGVTLPFAVIYQVDQAVIPFTLNKIKQVSQILSSRKESQINEDRDLAVTDIVSNPATEGVPNVQLNPEYGYYGSFQRPFKQAFEAAPTGPDKFYEDLDHVGYFITEMTLEDAGIQVDDTGQPVDEIYKNPANVQYRLTEASLEKAVTEFHKRGQGMDEEQIRKYLYPIHVVNKTTKPEKMYTFWRLPLEGSIELHLRRSGKWADYADPNRFKERGPFILDPSRTKSEQFWDAMTQDMGWARKAGVVVGSYAIQLPRIAFGTVEVAGDIIKWIVKKVAADTQQEEEAIDNAYKEVLERPEGQRLWADEFFGSGRTTGLALSQFYKVPLHAKLYQFSLDFAQDPTYDRRLFTGLLEGRTAGEGDSEITYTAATSSYMINNDPQVYQKMLDYYNSIWSQTNGADQEILDAINRRVQNPQPGSPGNA